MINAWVILNGKPSEKALDFPVDCHTLTGSVNLQYENSTALRI